MATVLSRICGLRRRGLLSLCVAFAFVVADVGMRESPFPGGSIAYADDDDDGDDDDDDGASGFSREGDRRRGASSGSRITVPKFLQFLKRPSRNSGKSRRASRQRPAAPAPYPADEIVAIGLDDSQITALIDRGFQIRSRHTVGAVGGEVVKLDPPAGQSLQAARDSVRELAPNASVDFNHFYSPSQELGCGGQPCVAPSLVGWPSTTVGQSCLAGNVTIGLIDTAINEKHETFRSSDIEVLRLDPAARSQSTRQHGTAVASLLVGTGPSGTPGLLPHAKLIAVDAFKANDRAEAYDLVRAIDLLAGRSVNVINMSLSGPDNALLARLVSTLGEKHVEIVAAAGNDGPSAKAAYPAAYENVIAVTAVDRRKRAYRRANQGDYVDIAAPGVGVWAAASIKGTRPKTGTSFAAPFVAAATALVKSRAPGQVPAIEILRKDAEDLGQPGKDPVFGWGLLNAENLCETG